MSRRRTNRIITISSVDSCNMNKYIEHVAGFSSANGLKKLAKKFRLNEDIDFKPTSMKYCKLEDMKYDY